MKKGGTTAIALVVLVIGVLGAVLLYSGTSSVTGAAPAGKVYLCHCPPGHFDPDTNQCDVVREPIQVSQNAVKSHKANHGDFEAIPDGQGGFTCLPDGEPSCGDGVITAPEVCDIGANAGDEGDDVGCDNPNGYGCIGCTVCEKCQDGAINSNIEECDQNDLPAGCTQCQPTCKCQTCDDQGYACTVGAADAPKNCAEGFTCVPEDPSVITGNGDECGNCEPPEPPTTTTTTVTTTTSSTTTTQKQCVLGTDECAPAGSIGFSNGCGAGILCRDDCTCAPATTTTTGTTSTTETTSTTGTTQPGGEGA